MKEKSSHYGFSYKSLKIELSHVQKENNKYGRLSIMKKTFSIPGIKRHNWKVINDFNDFIKNVVPKLATINPYQE